MGSRQEGYAGSKGHVQEKGRKTEEEKPTDHQRNQNMKKYHLVKEDKKNLNIAEF